MLAPLDDNGVYVAGYGWLSGRAAGTVAEDVAADLTQKGLLFDREPVTHRYLGLLALRHRAGFFGWPTNG